ncbi:haloacid dehalogenase-like hydrolase [Antarcticibacterium arcticum]|uniref:Haloacid dehalogenase-like hydrolase n=1 Tax=Antarcticibacterium arcticum TaxID=2585771 RepID=A0A5B8YKM8_9FLAO|nr:haloacid dehalogenase-like hydrolase [Antarcticibacterium arcticum]QED38254.1 haloacid dehalogenase-like hydrolase [Antarcticibacterium arcticum]
MGHNKEVIKVMVFDLNGTFYNKSSKDEFYKFIISKRPNRIKYYVEMVYYKLLLKVNQIRQTEFKENFFNYLDDFSPEQVKKYAAEFWEQEYPDNFNKELLQRFAELKAQNVVIFCATGGLELYVKPLFDLYKIDGFAGTCVKYTGHTYLVQGKACKDEEKINRLEEFLDGKAYRIIEAYSDSKEEILDRAEKAFLIKDGEITPY